MVRAETAVGLVLPSRRATQGTHLSQTRALEGRAFDPGPSRPGLRRIGILDWFRWEEDEMPSPGSSLTWGGAGVRR
jgi:hypothetical protein